MAGYPTMDQYNDAVQHPHTAFTDPVLKSAKIATNGPGLPIALGGSFALTYTATAPGRKFAVRCFHKEAKGLEARYGHVDKGLRGAGGSYFVGFEYQPAGILVNGNRFPIVKMDWVEGDTLGSFLEDNHAYRIRIEKLRAQFGDLERFLRAKGLAHGDLQNENVLVKSDLRLIDYDGLYVPTLPTGQGAELGHKHFQHPKRSAADFGPAMDRFSFIVIDLSLRAIAHDPKLFTRFSTGENIILNANDFIDPGGSQGFAALKAIPSLARDTESLANICTAPFSAVPTLQDWLAGKNIPAAPIIVRPPANPSTTAKEVAYVGAYEVVDGASFDAVRRQVGNRIELVGRITKIHSARTKYGKSYCFVFFNTSKLGVKLNIWSEGMAKLISAPSQSWVGQWVSVQGLVDPAWSSSRYGTSVSITITAGNQLRIISDAEARHRLQSPQTATSITSDNRSILQGIGTGRAAASRRGRTSPIVSPPTPQSRNQQLLDAIKPQANSTGRTTGTQYQPRPGHVPQSSGKRPLPWGWIILGAVVLAFILLGRR